MGSAFCLCVVVVGLDVVDLAAPRGSCAVWEHAGPISENDAFAMSLLPRLCTVIVYVIVSPGSADATSDVFSYSSRGAPLTVTVNVQRTSSAPTLVSSG